ncbi:hypothetical protein BJ878DRAFT_502283 [Calycina marina]|uniref:2EXR domain-containing protein n=1 Tax=Calycina marina TaxID=1763456 RepID=A0A9P7Z4R7_9HELO|nr:hypothetical protein BJ878DRAFT_502283 [Calycina marina]
MTREQKPRLNCKELRKELFTMWRLLPYDISRGVSHVGTAHVNEGPTLTVPNIYAVCRESRAIVKQYYTLAFRTENSPGTWIDFKEDVLYLSREICGDGSAFYENFQQVVKQVKNLAISGTWSSSKDLKSVYQLGSLIDITAILVGFGNLEWLALVDAQYKLDCTADLDIIYKESYESAEEYEKCIRPWAHPLYSVEEYLWPRWFLFGTLVDDSVEWRQDKGLREKVHAWRYNSQ